MGFITPEYPSNWDEIRKEVLELDQYICQSCRSKSQKLHIHHIIPRSERGADDAYNLVTLCEECFRARHPETTPDDVIHSSYLYCEKCDEKYSHETGLFFCPDCESFLITYVEPIRAYVGSGQGAVRGKPITV
jgi:protein-arginine kinase activator protein McsA